MAWVALDELQQGWRLVDLQGNHGDGLRGQWEAEVPVALKAYVGWAGDQTRWAAHTEVDDDPSQGESMESHSEADAVAWARERTDWVLVVTDPLQWAGAPEKQPSDVPQLWKG